MLRNNFFSNAFLRCWSTAILLPLCLFSSKSLVFEHQVANFSSQKEILQAMLQNSSKPDWTLTKALKKLDVQDSQVQKSLARIIVEQGPNKDLGLGKHMLALIKSLPRTLDVQAYDLWLQAVSMHQSFLSKMCTSELNKIVASKE